MNENFRRGPETASKGAMEYFYGEKKTQQLLFAKDHRFLTAASITPTKNNNKHILEDLLRQKSGRHKRCGRGFSHPHIFGIFNRFLVAISLIAVKNSNKGVLKDLL